MCPPNFTPRSSGAFAEKKPGEYLYLTMSEDPLGPGGSQTLHRGRPLSERLAHEVPFEGFHAGCRVLILDAYRRLWDL